MTTIGVFAAIFDPQGRILCVKMGYGSKNWTTPGGRLEKGESAAQALQREVEEESGYLIQPVRLVGAYSKTYNDDLVLMIEASILGRADWLPDGEIVEIGFFPREELPEPMSLIVRTRIQDAFDKQVGILREFTVNPSPHPHG